MPETYISLFDIFRQI